MSIAPSLHSSLLQPTVFGGAVQPRAPRRPQLVRQGKTVGNIRLIRLMAQGGMGEVWEGWDTRLQRRVAVKALRRDRVAKGFRARFLREARALSRLEHPTICAIHDYLSDGSDDFLVLEFIEGRSLKDVWRGDLSGTERFRIVLDLAEALAAAHTAGVVHRDLSPSNIMVTEEGRVKVLDFGLARSEGPSLRPAPEPEPPADLQDPSDAEIQTHHGSVMGTVAYMSPEQARGELVTTATDIYSLGLLFQELFTGEPARDGGSTWAEMLRHAGLGETRPLRGLSPGMTRLIRQMQAPEPIRRPTARELVRRLRRLRDAPRRRWQAAAALLLISGLSTWTGHLTLESRHADDRNSLARRTGARVEQLESQIRAAHLAPLHDIRAEREVVRRSIASLEAEAGALAPELALYARGRAHLALGDLDEARTALDAAWAAGLRDREVAWARGRALAEILRREARTAHRIRSTSLRRHRELLVEVRRQEALELLDHGATIPTVPVAWVEALSAAAGSNWSRALDRARTLRDVSTWSLQAARLEGEIHLAQAASARLEGRSNEASAALQEAAEAFERATRIGRSDPVAWAGRCEVALERALGALYGPGESDAAEYRAGTNACRTALLADPDSRQSRLLLASLHFRRAEAESQHGANVLPLLEEARAVLRPLTDATPDDPAAQRAVGLTWALQIHAVRGDETAAVHAYENATRAFRRSLEGDPADLRTLTNLGTTLGIGSSLAQDPAEVTERLRRAAAAFEHIVDLDPQQKDAWMNLGVAANFLAERAFEKGRSPEPELRRALPALDEVLRLDPSFAYAFNSRGFGWSLRAEWLASRELDPSEAWENARRSFERSLELQPSHPPTISNLGTLNLREAEWRIWAGGELEPVLSLAIDACSRAAELNPAYEEAWSCLTRALLLEARTAETLGEDPGPSLRRARAANGHLAPSSSEALEILLAEAEVGSIPSAGLLEVASFETSPDQQVRAALLVARTASSIPESVVILENALGNLETSGSGLLEKALAAELFLERARIESMGLGDESTGAEPDPVDVRRTVLSARRLLAAPGLVDSPRGTILTLIADLFDAGQESRSEESQVLLEQTLADRPLLRPRLGIHLESAEGTAQRR